MRWQVPWGKHSPAWYRGRHVAAKWGEGVVQSDVLPIVVVKDPLSWMGSMCRHKYATNWPHSPNHCPNLVPNDVDRKVRGFHADGSIPVRVRYNKTHFTEHSTLAGLWNDWYGAYYNATYPRLIVRFEDLLFHPEYVMGEICKCGGAELNTNFRITTGNAKPELGPHVGTTSGMVAAIVRYGNAELRLNNFTNDDLEFAQSNLHPELMAKFHYTVPI